MADRLVYILALAVLGLVRRLPLALCFVVGQAGGALMWLILPGYRRLARENLTIAFGHELSPSQIRRLAFKHFTTLGANVVSAIKIPALAHDAIDRIATIENLDLIRQNIAKGRPVLLAITWTLLRDWTLGAASQAPESR